MVACLNKHVKLHPFKLQKAYDDYNSDDMTTEEFMEIWGKPPKEFRRVWMKMGYKYPKATK